MDNSLELFRGQIEENLGRIQQTLGSLQGPRGMMTTLSGRRLEMRGRARQSMARVRMGFEGLSESLRGTTTTYSPYAPWIVLGLGLGALALFSPRTFNSLWQTVRSSILPYAQRYTQQVQQGPFTDEARRTLFGQTNR